MGEHAVLPCGALILHLASLKPLFIKFFYYYPKDQVNLFLLLSKNWLQLKVRPNHAKPYEKLNSSTTLFSLSLSHILSGILRFPKLNQFVDMTFDMLL